MMSRRYADGITVEELLGLGLLAEQLTGSDLPTGPEVRAAQAAAADLGLGPSRLLVDALDGQVRVRTGLLALRPADVRRRVGDTAAAAARVASALLLAGVVEASPFARPDEVARARYARLIGFRVLDSNPAEAVVCAQQVLALLRGLQTRQHAA